MDPPATGEENELCNSVSRCATPCRLGAAVEDRAGAHGNPKWARINQIQSVHQNVDLNSFPCTISFYRGFLGFSGSYFKYLYIYIYISISFKSYFPRAKDRSTGGNVSIVFRKTGRRLAKGWTAQLESEGCGSLAALVNRWIHRRSWSNSPLLGSSKH